MKPAICLQAYIPMREAASEAAEMGCQLLFGDLFQIMEEQPRWYRIRRDCDGYEGWIDRKTATLLSEEEYQFYAERFQGALLLSEPFQRVSFQCQSGLTLEMFLSWGSKVYGVSDCAVTAPMDPSRETREACALHLVRQARKLLHVPYLWGGNTAFGLDCSGFTQSLFRFIGCSLPRNASQQAQLGREIPYGERACGDLAFFNHGESTSRVSHVGLCDDRGGILHCSGYLREDELRPEGIWNREQNRLTHPLMCIRRIF